MYKFGTVKELNSMNMVVPEKVYQEVLGRVHIIFFVKEEFI